MPADIQGRTALLCEPLIATGDTVIAAIERLKSHDVKRIRVLNILISEHAVERLKQAHPDVDVFTLGVEREMNADHYLVPGLGDAGDRLFQTK
jgi:uracil phosphoribosyltransferase